MTLGPGLFPVQLDVKANGWIEQAYFLHRKRLVTACQIESHPSESGPGFLNKLDVFANGNLATKRFLDVRRSGLVVSMRLSLQDPFNF